MARTESLSIFLTDVADSIREKKGTTAPIKPADFDTEIESIQSGGADFEINDGSYLFYNGARDELVDTLLPLCKNMTNTTFMFYGSKCDKPIELTHEQLDTLNITGTYSRMFYTAKFIPEIKISSTSSKPTAINYMFYGCTNAEKIDISELNTENISDMSSTFQDCTNLKEIIFGENFNVNKVSSQSFNNFFSGCSSLENIDISNLTFPLVTKFTNVFYGCKNAKCIKMPKFSKKITEISYLFYACDNLKTIDWNGFDASGVTSISGLFASGSTDTTIDGTIDLDLVGLGLISSKVTSYYQPFKGNKCLRTVKLDLFSTKTFTTTGLEYWFKDCSSLIELDLAPIHVNATGTTSYRELFSGSIRLKNIKNISNLTTSGLNNNGYGIYKMFYNCKSLETLDVSWLNTTNVITNTSYYSTSGWASVFEGCESLKTIDISNFVANAKMYRTSYMFRNCKSLETVVLPDLTSSSINNLEYMFDGCSSLKNIDMSKLPFAISNSNYRLFAETGLENVVISQNMANGTATKYFQYMFYNCPNLKTVDISATSKFSNTSSNLESMFAECPNLEYVDISGMWNLKENSFKNMFKNCTSLKTVKFHHNSTEPVIFKETWSWVQGAEGMFDGCISIEKIDMRYFMQGGQTYYGKRVFAECRNLKYLDLRGYDFGILGTDNSAWKSGSSTTNETLLNMGADLDTPTMVYTDTEYKQKNLIALGNKYGLGWTTDNVIVVDNMDDLDWEVE